MDDKGAPQLSAFGLLTQTLADVLALAPGIHLRLAGHSLGSPLVIAGASGLLSQSSPPLLAPMRLRLALLDPYWSRQLPLANPQGYLPRGRGHTTAARSLELAMEPAALGVLIEVYRSCPVMTEVSQWADSSPVTKLVQQTKAVMVRYTADFCPPWDLEAQHLAAPALYLHSFCFSLSIEGAPSASFPDDSLRQRLGSVWEQTAGGSFPDMSRFLFRQTVL